MHAIGLSSAIYLAYVLLLLPWVAFKSARAFNARLRLPGPAAALPLERIYANTIAMLVVLFALSWVTARSFQSERLIFAAPHIGARELLAGVAALLFYFVMMYANLTTRSPDERRAMAINRLVPRTRAAKLLYSATSIVAGVAEEAAYRGVLVWILAYALGSSWPAVIVSAAAFAFSHALQGWKSMVVIFIMACSMHALVWYTGTLVIAMAVHAIYDLLAPTVRRRISPVPPTDPERIAG
jgi:hypothetical protein